MESFRKKDLTKPRTSQAVIWAQRNNTRRSIFAGNLSEVYSTFISLRYASSGDIYAVVVGGGGACLLRIVSRVISVRALKMAAFSLRLRHRGKSSFAQFCLCENPIDLSRISLQCVRIIAPKRGWVDVSIRLQYFVQPGLDSVPLFVRMREGSIVGLTSPETLSLTFVISGN